MTTGTRTALGGTGGGEPIAELRALREEQRRLERSISELVRRARVQGYSWQAIGGALEISKQAAHKRFGRR